MPRRKAPPFEWITSKDAAQILHVTDRQVRRMAAAGKFEMKEVSPRVKLFDKREVEAYAARREAGYAA